MSETERNQIKGALLKCAEENENKPTFTGHVVVSSVCRSAVERIEELEEMLEKVQKNEWHEIESKISPKREISKKYMPKSEEKVLLKYHFYDDNEVHISDGYYDAYDFQFHIANNPKHRIVCVIAWKELPKEIE